MWKAALLMLVVGVTVGALMPTPPAADDGSKAAQQPYVVQQSASTRSAASQVSSGASVALPRREDGHFYANAEVNGSTIEFMVDTGASVVSLSRADAERAGITVDPDQFEVVAEGASGPVMGTAVVLREVSLGDHRVNDVPALVLADSRQSLLGQNFLSQFQSVSIENDQMMLR
jgi:aspartyl protease family protein